GQVVVTGMANGTATICEATTGKLLHVLPGKTDAAHRDQIQSAAFSPDDKWIVTASDVQTAKIWERATGDLKSTMRHKAGVYAAAFTEDGTVVTVDQQKKVTTWDWQKAIALFDWSEPVTEVVGTSFSRNGRWLFTTDQHGRTTVMDTAARKTVHGFN